MTKKKPGDKAEVRGVDPAWLMTKKLGISLAEAHARLAAEAKQAEATKEDQPTTPPTTE